MYSSLLSQGQPSPSVLGAQSCAAKPPRALGTDFISGVGAGERPAGLEPSSALPMAVCRTEHL